MLAVASSLAAALPLAAVPPAPDESTPDLFLAILAANAADRFYVLEAEPYDARGGVVSTEAPLAAVAPIAAIPATPTPAGRRTVYYASRGYATGAADIPAHTPMPARLAAALNVQATLFAGDEPNGAAQISAGEIRLLQSQPGADTGDLAFLAAMGWDGARIAVKLGAPNFAYADFPTVYLGTADAVAWSNRAVAIRLRDRRTLLEVPVIRETAAQSGRYAGTGGVEGSTEIKGRAKPWSLGRLFNVAPVPIDPFNLVYQLSWRSIQAVTAVRDQGVALTADGDTASYAALIAAGIAGGHYRTCRALGLVRLGGAPAGTITCDVEGDDVADGAGGYIEKTGAVMRRVAGQAAGFGAAEIDEASFIALDLARPFAIGFLATADLTAAAACDALAAAIHAAWAFDRDGRLRVVRVAPPEDGTPAGAIGAADAVDAAPELIQIRPAWRRRVGWRRNWQVQSPDQLATSVAQDDAIVYGAEYRFVEGTDAAVKTMHAAARDVATPTFVALEADAATLAGELKRLHGRLRRRGAVTLKASLFRHRLGDVIAVTLPGHGLAALPMMVVGLTEDAQRDETTVELYG